MGTVLDVATLAMTVEQGKSARREAETQALAEEAAGVSREADRKERLAMALASQNAAAGSAGVAAFEGSPLTILKEDIKREQKATGRDIFQTQLAAKTLRARGKIAEKQAKLRGFLQFASSTEQRAQKSAMGGS